MSGPVLRILEGPSATSKGVSNALTGGTAPLLSAGSKAADLYAHDKDGLMQILHFRLQIAKAAAARSTWFGGRLYNKFSGKDPDYIPLSGSHLRQTFAAAAIETPDVVVAAGRYELRVDIAEQALAALVAEPD